MMPHEDGVTFTAIVHTPDGVRFVATGATRDAVAARIAHYVRERSDDVLSADAACEVHTLLALGDLSAAITAYFEYVGERWEDERLELFTAEQNGAHWTSDERRLIDARH